MQSLSKISLFYIILISISLSAKTKNFHKHDGFYLSVAIGPSGVNITTTTDNDFLKLELNEGRPRTTDFKIGYAITENLIISGDIIATNIIHPDFEITNTDSITGESLKLTGNFIIEFREVLLGIGVTYYFMPHNTFVSGTIAHSQLENGSGIAIFDFDRSSSVIESSKHTGIGFQLKAGKEFWISDNWSLGGSIALGVSVVSDDDLKEETSIGRFSVLFNTTFN